VVLAAAVLLCVQAPLLAVRHELPVGVAIALAAAHTGSAVLALQRPVPGAGLSLVVVTLQALAIMPQGVPGWPWAVPPQVITQLLVLLVVAATAGWRLAGATLALQLVIGFVLAVVGWGWTQPDDALGSVALAGALGMLVGSLGVLARRLSESREALQRERTLTAEEQARRTVVEEKARIARELHDVIAHNMSLITVQARSAPHRVDDVSPAAAAEFGEIADLAAEALRQMRGVLDVLRTEPGQSGRMPVPGLDGLGELVESARATGQRIDVHGSPPRADAVAPEVGAAAYRIMQEALSNARRHAPHAPVRVDLRAGESELEIRVANPLDGPLEAGAEGHGLVGMRERASSVGGRVRTGAPTAEEYVVEARLPVRRALGGAEAS